MIALDARLTRRFVPSKISLAAGSMLGDAFFHLLPELYDHQHSDTPTALGVLSGLFLFYLLELFVRRRRAHPAAG